MLYYFILLLYASELLKTVLSFSQTPLVTRWTFSIKVFVSVSYGILDYVRERIDCIATRRALIFKHPYWGLYVYYKAHPQPFQENAGTWSTETGDYFPILSIDKRMDTKSPSCFHRYKIIIMLQNKIKKILLVSTY